MNRTFIEVPMFTKKWHELGLTDEELRNLENVLLENPKAGDAIQGTGGLRKIRVSMESKGKGKRGGARVIYVDIEVKETVYFINVYTKNEKDDLTEDEKKAFKTMVKILKEV
ncbi:type II toxin-antitoxin system RelE/ParE family toxin [Roseburia hominis]|uniref:type II toxin-antitoxin system RelE/ParE family toxin n=1 Tax=Roseburia hominis TaxID=301301 RepID=UPI001F3A52D2|nr:type II toxin-antitoxin system RelE/ParE family toxin [Roseburia hominis]